MRVLVTGGCGYIGSSLISHLLAHGFSVVNVDSCIYHNAGAIGTFWNHPAFEHLSVDVRDISSYRQAIATADVVIPLAAIVGAPACDASSPDFVNAVNRDAIIALLKELSRRQYVVFPCSNSGYGQTSGQEECTEEQPLNPISLYGRSKVEAEKAILDHGGCSLRLATVYGVSGRMRFDLLVNDLVRMFAHEGRVRLYQGNYVRSIAFIGDVVRAFEFAIWRDLTGVYNVVEPGGNVTKRELSKKISLAVWGEDRTQEGEGEDVDQRNYRVSGTKLSDADFRYLGDFQQNIRPVIQYAYLLSPPAALKMGNRP